MRGAAWGTTSDLTAASPLPPRARGCQVMNRCGGEASPSTPACAGLPKVSTVMFVPWHLYPRVRGAAPPVPSNHGMGAASTPACAGLPSQGAARSPRESLYPRVRGAAMASQAARSRSRPLPPRARG